MSKEIMKMENTGTDDRDLTISQFWGGIEKGKMLQLTQGLDEPGFIQLTRKDAYLVIIELAKWIKETSKKNADKLKKKIAENKSLEKTIFQDIVDCQKFIDDLEILDIPIYLMNRYTKG